MDKTPRRTTDNNISNMIDIQETIRRGKISFLIGLFLIFTMAMGAVLMCAHSGGNIETQGFACVHLDVLGACQTNTDTLPSIAPDTLPGGWALNTTTRRNT